MASSTISKDDAFFKPFESFSKPELDNNISNERFVFIINKIQNDFMLMKTNKLWKPKEQRIDEECCVEDEEDGDQD